MNELDGEGHQRAVAGYLDHPQYYRHRSRCSISGRILVRFSRLVA